MISRRGRARPEERCGRRAGAGPDAHPREFRAHSDLDGRRTAASDGAVVVTLVDPRDPDGDPVTFTTTAPGSGTVLSDGVTFTYTPTAAARDLALHTPGEDADQFTIALTDGHSVTNIPVTVSVSPTPLQVVFDVESTEITVGYPTGAAVVDDRLYVVSEDGFVRVIDAEGTVGAPMAVDWSSSTIAAAPDGDRVYVDSPWAGTISVIDTATNEVVASHPLGYFTDLDISEDGRYLYGTSGTTVITDPATVSVIDTESMTPIVTTTLGPVWDHTRTSGEYADTTHSAAVNADGTQLYVSYSRHRDRHRPGKHHVRPRDHNGTTDRPRAGSRAERRRQPGIRHRRGRTHRRGDRHCDPHRRRNVRDRRGHFGNPLRSAAERVDRGRHAVRH
ncbi:YncE family protein [Rhodococcus opacus]|uniref:YncE family protein n=1 Tax=Rhodococcus opacus TaxID=37919 RepID=UPI00155AC00E|nr:hypothetical protein [Rhodococcus opacus]